MKKLLEDVSLLSGVSETTLKKFIKLSDYAIGHALHESLKAKEEFLTIDIGAGELQIKCTYDNIRYRFIPSEELSDILSKTVVTGVSPVATRLEENLQEKIDKAYKELL